LAALLLVSGAAKVRRLAEFEGAVLAGQFVPRRLARHTARWVALLEFALVSHWPWGCESRRGNMDQ